MGIPHPMVQEFPTFRRDYYAQYNYGTIHVALSQNLNLWPRVVGLFVLQPIVNFSFILRRLQL